MTWDESQHPRHPAGSAQGGEWTSKTNSIGTETHVHSSGIQVSGSPGVKPKNVDKVRAVIDKMPREVLDRAGQPTVRVVKGQIAGHGAHAVGTNAADLNHIRVTETRVGHSDIREATAHEIAHSILNRGDYSLANRAAWLLDMQNGKSKVLLGHYTLNEHEAAAKAFAIATGNGHVNRAEFVKAFPNTMKHVTTWLGNKKGSSS